eukprot:TRINITY_DN567_c0_g2_i1.p1 TRINITY_DN567_c0_g2~~TRINITY_DN567_c0_g2_i1.p1  ORF type:complete len:115 (-),score=10.78 TRINITY_DN567_c0_g2_i1:371-715(-)
MVMESSSPRDQVNQKLESGEGQHASMQDTTDSKSKGSSAQRKNSRSRSATRSRSEAAPTSESKTSHRSGSRRSVSRCPSPYRCRPADYALRRRALAASVAAADGREVSPVRDEV